MFKDKIKKLGKKEENGQKRLENIIFLIVILIITIIIINTILKQGKSDNTKNENEVDKYKVLATDLNIDEKNSNDELNNNLEGILSTIKGVGKVHVFINYSESSKTVAMYDEKTTATSTEETDSQGGLRNTTSTETQKDVIYSDSDGNKEPVTESVIMPKIEGAIITAEGASNANVKTNIINAVQAVTGLSMDKIQVFEINK